MLSRDFHAGVKVAVPPNLEEPIPSTSATSSIRQRDLVLTSASPHPKKLPLQPVYSIRRQRQITMTNPKRSPTTA